MRQVIGLPHDKRLLSLENWPPLSDYQSGVLTMLQAVKEDAALGARERLLSVGVLVWLSLSPVLRRTVRGIVPLGFRNGGLTR